MFAVILSIICICSLLHGEVHGNCMNSNPFYRSVKVNANTECPIAVDCKEWYDAGMTTSGIYPINPGIEEAAFQVYCDMETDGGGWTVLMRRQDGSVEFTNRNWADYEAGFGKLNGEFWLGLSKMHRITSSGENTLKVDLGDFENDKVFASYSGFEILDDTADYIIVVKGYSGSAGDSLYSAHNLMRFSTKDKDNDLHEITDCAVHYGGGGWWFNDCFKGGSYLTGPYYQGGSTGENGAGIIWSTWKGYSYSLKFVEWKTRRRT